MSTVYWPSRNPVVTEEAGTRGGTHAGIDLRASLNDPVLAAFDGTVVYVGGDGASGRIWLGNRWLYPNGQGKTVDIRRKDGLISRVGHLNGYAVKQGQKVKAGQVVGYAGTTGYSTGVHIHWELRWDRAWTGGRWINPRSMKPRIYTAPKPAKKGIKVIHYARKDKDARAKGRNLAPGKHLYLNTKSGGPSNAANIVGGVGPYSITTHLYAQGEPGDVLGITLIWVDSKGKRSQHYNHHVSFDKDGLIRENVEFKRAVPSGTRVFARVLSSGKNRKNARITLFDSDAYLIK